ncbi:hypothetical protein A4A49_08814 [Nicotiana attenuata]|uniref:Uncharacterized protein n=1 Tax=Nicotiana attenuata TaxID=49451 RepID=A0A1J6IC61_NICAT|nr:hypothetical protein A4A49_08814 [Nicotiana attenuata]
MCYSGVPYWVGNQCKRERRGGYRPVARERVASEVSTGSIGAGMKKFQCVCSPTKHPGSFRCRHHHSEYKWVAPLRTKPNHLAASVVKPL